MRKLFIALIFSLSLLTVTSAFTSPLPNVTDNKIILNFPEPGVQSISTLVLTIIPFGGMASTLQATPTPGSTSSFSTQPTETPVHGRPPLSLTLILLGLCCVFLLLIGMLILGFVVRKQNIKEWKNDQQSNSR